jgi:hypothetical protein
LTLQTLNQLHTFNNRITRSCKPSNDLIEYQVLIGTHNQLIGLFLIIKFLIKNNQAKNSYYPNNATPAQMQ